MVSVDGARYEFSVIIRPDIATSRVSELEAEIRSVTEKAGGKVVHAEYCGLMSLAYPVTKNTKAHFILFDIEAPTQALSPLEHFLRFSGDVLRFLRVRVRAFSEKPSVLASSHVNREQFGKAQFRQPSIRSSAQGQE